MLGWFQQPLKITSKRGSLGGLYFPTTRPSPLGTRPAAKLACRRGWCCCCGKRSYAGTGGDCVDCVPALEMVEGIGCMNYMKGRGRRGDLRSGPSIKRKYVHSA